MNGAVKWFNTKRGFGFITDADGLDYFVHFSEIDADGFRKLKDGQTVTFEPDQDEEGRSIATRVKAGEEA